MSRLKKYVALLLCIIVASVGTSINVKADSLIDGSKLLKEDTSVVIIENPAKGNLLNKGTASISNNGNGTVNVYGAVLGSVVCDKMILEMTLQRYSNGSWINVKSFSNTAYNTSLLTKSYNVSVTRGYYYRVKAACVAQKNGVSESRVPVTDGILIN